MFASLIVMHSASVARTKFRLFHLGLFLDNMASGSTDCREFVPHHYKPKICRNCSQERDKHLQPGNISVLTFCKKYHFNGDVVSKSFKSL